MKIEEDGHLCLHRVNLMQAASVEENRRRIENHGLYAFSYDAQITAGYAWAAGHKVTYAEVGLLMEVPKRGSLLC